MNGLNDFKNVMLEETELALATSVDNQSNVRIVNFITKEDKSNVLYFASFMGNPKVEEFSLNEKISFTTIPKIQTAYVRVHKGIVIKSEKSIYDLADDFISKIPDYKEIIDAAAKALIVYEIHFFEATVTLDFKSSYEVNFDNWL